MKQIVVGTGQLGTIIPKHFDLSQCDVIVTHQEHLMHQSQRMVDIEPITKTTMKSLLPTKGSKYHK